MRQGRYPPFGKGLAFIDRERGRRRPEVQTGQTETTELPGDIVGSPR